MEPIKTTDELLEYIKDKYDCDVFVEQELYDKLHKIPLSDIHQLLRITAYVHNINIVLTTEQEEA